MGSETKKWNLGLQRIQITVNNKIVILIEVNLSVIFN